MSNPFADDLDPVREGFLCPICKEDQKTADRLTIHFEKDHYEEQDLLKSFKDIFITAKKKIRYFDDNAQSSVTNQDNSVGGATKSFSSSFTSLPKVYQLPISQGVGAFCDHYEYFKTIRTPGLERFATETNKLIIRLHKLLTDRPSDSVQRKQQEQMLVPWLNGNDVKLCPNCAAKFNITRRQHHCRLCGSIMCHNCSRFLSIPDAMSIVNPTVLTPTETIDAKDDNLRTCDYCLHLLYNRKDMQDSKCYRPQICIYYDKIQELKKSIQPDIEMYNRMITSLYDGDSIFTLSDASALRGKIGRAAELIDSYSKAIVGVASGASGSLEESLKKSVRLASIKYIKDEMISLEPLPLETDIKAKQERRKRETQQRIEMERRLAQEAIEKYEMAAGSNGIQQQQQQLGNSMTSVQKKINNVASGSAVTSLDNWSGHQATDSRSANDPLIEQINIIKGYIKQARQALRFDEVATLELNLRELEQEFYRQKININ